MCGGRRGAAAAAAAAAPRCSRPPSPARACARTHAHAHALWHVSDANPAASASPPAPAGNPLLSGDGGAGEPAFGVKRRWDDDVVFKGQSKGEPKAQKRFINDTIRSDFHSRFLKRYIR